MLGHQRTAQRNAPVDSEEPDESVVHSEPAPAEEQAAAVELVEQELPSTPYAMRPEIGQNTRDSQSDTPGQP